MTWPAGGENLEINIRDPNKIIVMIYIMIHPYIIIIISASSFDVIQPCFDLSFDLIRNIMMIFGEGDIKTTFSRI